jgi:hypothetical protein
MSVHLLKYDKNPYLGKQSSYSPTKPSFLRKLDEQLITMNKIKLS